MSTEVLEKPNLRYVVRKLWNINTGALVKRAFPLPNRHVTLGQLSEKLASDRGQMAGNAAHVKNAISTIFNAIIDELADGNEVMIDDYAKFRLSFRGEVDAATGKPVSETTLGASIHPLKKMRNSLDLKNFTPVNVEAEPIDPKFTALFACALSATKDRIVRGLDFQMNGSNLYYDGEMGDTVIARFTVKDEAEQAITLTPKDCNPGSITFGFPVALTEIAAGTEIEITLSTRSGVQDGVFNIASRKAVLAEA